jgi:hypothetical protein
MPYGPPNWISPKKVEKLCNEYVETYGDNKTSKILRAQHQLIVAYRAIRLKRDEDKKIEAPRTFAMPYLERADALLNSFNEEDRSPIWYISRLRLLSLQQLEDPTTLRAIRERYPTNAAVFKCWAFIQSPNIEEIEEEIKARHLDEVTASILYARAITELALDSRGQQAAIESEVSWDKLNTGLRAIYEKYPCDYNYDVYRFFACWQNDKELAKELFQNGPERPISFLWSTSEFPFEDWKQWATGKTTFPLVETNKEMIGVWRITDAFKKYPIMEEGYYERYPTYYIYHPDNMLQIIRVKDGGMNYKTRAWEIIEPGHLKITKTKHHPIGQSWSQTVFSDCENMVNQHLAAPYGTTYLNYQGTIETQLPEIEKAYYQLNNKPEE